LSANINGEGVNSHGASAGGKSQLESDSFDTRHVDTSAWLVLFGLQSKRVHVDTRGRASGVVEVGLQHVEVSSLSSSNTVMSIELNLCVNQWVVTRVGGRSITVVSEVNPTVVSSNDVGIRLDNPNNFFSWVAEVQLLTNTRVTVGFGPVALELLDEIFVIHLGEHSPLGSIEENVVEEKRNVLQHWHGSQWYLITCDHAFDCGSEGNINFR